MSIKTNLSTHTRKMNVHQNKLQQIYHNSDASGFITFITRWQTRISHWWDNVMKLLNEGHQTLTQGKVGIAQWLERRTRDRKVVGSSPAGEFSSQGSTFCADSYFGIRSTPVLPQYHARKISRSFCRKCRWQFTTKHAWLYGVHRTRRVGSCFESHQPSKN